MSYLLDKKSQRKKFSNIALGVVILIILFFFRSGIWNVLSDVSLFVFRPVLSAGDSIGGGLKSFGAYFVSKSSLLKENENLQQEVAADDARMANYDSAMADDASLKEILGRKDPKATMVLGAILSKPNQSPYDTRIIDAGTAQGIKVADIVFADGAVPIGRVAEANANSSKVILFSNPGESTEVTVSGQSTSVQLVGRGGGNFEISLPKDSALAQGTQVTLPGINDYVIAITQTTISDPRDPLSKALLTSPVNIQNLKFVEVAP